MCAQPTIYVDHTIVTHESAWPHLRQAIISSGLRLTLSAWNLFEIGAASDRCQQDRRLAFLESLNPIWIIERVEIQKQEMKRFLWRHCFDRTAENPIVFTPFLSVMASFWYGPNTPIGLTPRELIDRFNYTFLNPLKKLSPQAQASMKAADPKVLKKKDHDMFVAWIKRLIPTHDPDFRPLAAAAQAELGEFCYRNRLAFLAECPGLAVEDALTDHRIGDRRRKPTETDGPDGQHTVMALAYCNIFFTTDGYQASSAKTIRHKLKTMHLAEICERPEQLAARIAVLSSPADARQ
jgi:hypothetical protein